MAYQADFSNPAYSFQGVKGSMAAGAAFMGGGPRNGSQQKEEGTAAAGGSSGLQAFGQENVAKTQGDTAQKVATIGADSEVKQAGIYADASKFGATQQKEGLIGSAQATAAGNVAAAGLYAGAQQNAALFNSQASMYGSDQQLAAAKVQAKASMANSRNQMVGSLVGSALGGLTGLAGLFVR